MAKILKEAKAYMKKQPKSSKLVTYNDIRVDQDLLTKFTECVFKTTEWLLKNFSLKYFGCLKSLVFWLVFV